MFNPSNEFLFQLLDFSTSEFLFSSHPPSPTPLKYNFYLYWYSAFGEILFLWFPSILCTWFPLALWAYFKVVDLKSLSSKSHECLGFFRNGFSSVLPFWKGRILCFVFLCMPFLLKTRHSEYSRNSENLILSLDDWNHPFVSLPSIFAKWVFFVICSHWNLFTCVVVN